MTSVRDRLRLTPLGQATTCLCLALLALTAMAWIGYHFDSERVAWRDYMTLKRACILLVFYFATAFAFYWTGKLWLEATPSGQTDLDHSWRSGMRGLQRLNLDLKQLPMFIILGSRGVEQQRDLLHAANQRVLLDGISPGSGPINWFATDEAVYLFCNSAGVLGTSLEKLARVYEYTPRPHAIWYEAKRPVHEAEEAPEQEPPTAAASTREDSPSLVGSTASDATATKVTTTPLAKSDKSAQLRVESEMDELEEVVRAQLEEEAVLVRSIDPEIVAQESSYIPLSSTELLSSQHILGELARRLRSARRPVAAINGIGIVIDDRAALHSVEAARQCGMAIREDIELLENALGLQAPMSLLVCGVEREPGLQEAIRRMGREQSDAGMLGAACDPRAIYDAQSLPQAATRSLLSISNCIYELLRHPAALHTPGNEHLVKLLIRCRHEYPAKLAQLVSTAFGRGAKQTDSPTYLAGVHFVATGRTARTRGFAQAAFERMLGQQHLISWTTRALRQQFITLLMTRVMQLVSLTAAFLFFYQIVTR